MSTGLTKAVIDSYLNGRANEQGYTQQADPYNDIVAIAGGEQQYREMLEYVGTLPSDQIDAFNDIVDAKTPNVPQIAVTVQNMYNQYKQAMGIEPKLMSGKASNTPSIKTFQSNAEVVAAMRDPRYKKDIAYQHEVQRRLQESNVFGISE